MATLRDLVVDCEHPASLARFWADALDGYSVAPYDEAELERLLAVGVSNPEDDPSVVIVGPDGAPRIWFQFVEEPKRTKNRMHVDLTASSSDDVERLIALGAQRHAIQPPSPPEWVVLEDPEGNEFCVFLAAD